ncbi:hypothetical protein LCGC14_2626700 [marine sediment metagenome]|uniref:Methyltransferase FkbM domain-containing protein n=1 Tax=marine sediment metagenome TaxID=412755 RepID=A0A0F9CU08_9ZZZZ
MLEKIGGLHYIDFKRMRKNPVIVDAGACMGKYIEIMNERIDKPRIFAIECDMENIEILKEKDFPNTVINEKALMGHRSKERMIYHKYVGLPYSGSVGYEKTYLKKRLHGKCKEIYKRLVDTFAINDIFSEFGIDRIDYLKMNIEGAERDVLLAMTEETASRIDQISISIHAKIREDLEASPLKESAGVDILDRLNDLGFNASKVDRRLMYGVTEV